jgi:cyclic pyranopterin phosphate synthase
MPRPTHIDERNQPGMVNVSDKNSTRRTASAKAEVYLPAEAWQYLENDEFTSKKGPVLQTAIIAGTMAAKRTSDLIPLCHPLAITGCRFESRLEKPALYIYCHVHITNRTGVEMEALTGATIAALTVYDMLKSVSHQIEIRNVSLVEKSGGKNDFRR